MTTRTTEEEKTYQGYLKRAHITVDSEMNCMRVSAITGL